MTYYVLKDAAGVARVFRKPVFDDLVDTRESMDDALALADEINAARRANAAQAAPSER